MIIPGVVVSFKYPEIIQQPESLLTASDAALGDKFGYSVKINAAGTLMVVAALRKYYIPDDNSKWGVIYTYKKINDTWELQDVLTRTWGFGEAIALNPSGTILVVLELDNWIIIYDRVNNSWVYRSMQYLYNYSIFDTPSESMDASVIYRNATAISINEDCSVLAHGSPDWEVEYWVDEETMYMVVVGGVNILDWNGVNWVHRSNSYEPDILPDSSTYTGGLSVRFGAAVSLNADATILAVGAPMLTQSLSRRGGVYIYDWSGSAWVQRGGVLFASDAAASDYFGTSVALSPDGLVLAVSASGWEDQITSQGRVYMYDWSGSAWVERNVLIVPDDATSATTALSDGFGKDISINSDGSLVVVGAPFWEGDFNNQGRVYILSS